ncbi:hypothetical protein VPHD148_0281 [Vibrio phage D148]
MDYSTETLNVQFLNNAFIDKLDQGLTKEAGAAMSTFVRQKLREDGFARKIFTPMMVTASDLDRGLDDQPRVIIEKEPDSIAATLPLSGKEEIRYFKGSRYEVGFYKIESKEFIKSKFELSTYKTDIRHILQENSVKDLQKEEDSNLLTGLGQIFRTRTTDFAEDPTNGYLTSTSLDGVTVVDKLMQMVQFLVDDFQKPGKLLLSHQLYLAVLREPATQLGDAHATAAFKTGAIDTFYGFEIITSNKSDLLSSDFLTTGAPSKDRATKGDIAIAFAPEQYLGQFYSLQEPTVFLKSEADMISFKTYEAIGIGIGNTQAFIIGQIDPRL